MTMTEADAVVREAVLTIARLRKERAALLVACELALVEAHNCFASHYTESSEYAPMPRHIVALREAIEMVKM